MTASYSIRTLRCDEVAMGQLLRAEVFCHERHWIDPQRLSPDGREADAYDNDAIHGGAFVEDDMIGTFRLIPAGTPPLPVEAYYRIPPCQRAVELSRLAVLPEHRLSVAMIGLCRWIYGEAVEFGATHMYALMEFELISQLQNYGFPFKVLRGPHMAYKHSIDFTTVCPVADVVPGLAEADRQHRRKLAPLFAEPFDGEISLSMLYPTPEEEMA